MEVADPVSAILKQKGGQIWTIGPQSTVFEALELMANKEVGALLVMQGQSLAGIFSERDYARKVILKGRSSRDTRVEEVMIARPRTITPECAVSEAMHLMTENRFRHLPVTGSEGEILGMISIGDIVKWVITSQEATIQQLHSYISSG